MKKIIQKVSDFVTQKPELLTACFILCMAVVMTASPGLAVDDLADWGSNAESQFKGIAGAAKMFFYLFGFIGIGIGMIMLAVSRQKKIAITLVIIGIVLSSIGVFISMGSASFFGSDVSETEQLFN